MITKLSAKHCLTLVATVLVSTSACAIEVPATPDTRNCKAEYPRSSIANEEQGTVSMSLLVSANGEVKDSRLNKSSGYRTLDSAAMRKMAACRFAPGTKDGAPADTWTRVDYAWKID
ncbi:energy transducer TonB [Massilia sp. METH4]|uniref:energy transducer TonB n=1 Tax=Massilia sp. METH4 TaxID=3123041 RepID=UPI0030CCB379